jgi:hypothetical protein
MRHANTAESGDSMSRAVPLRFTMGIVAFPLAALLSAECGGNDVIDSGDATTDAASEGSPGDAPADRVLADGSGTSSQDSTAPDVGVDAAGGVLDATNATDAESSVQDALADASEAAGLDARVEAGSVDGASAADADASVDAGSADANEAEADAGEADADAQGPVLLGPVLGTARTFALLAGATITSTGATAIFGDVGVSPGSAEVGLTAGQVTGTIYLGDPVAMKAEQDLTTAYNNLVGRPCQHPMSSVDLGGKTLPPGVYCFGVAAAQMVGDLTLDGQGDPNAVWIFQIASTLTIAASVSTTMINAGNACNVYWQVGSSATINIGAQLKGNILAQASISLLTGASISPGRALTQTAAVTMDTNAISNAGCQ